MQQNKYKFFGRRKGKTLTKTSNLRLETLLPKICIDDDLKKLKCEFANFNELYLEVGFGGGEHLARQAKANPNGLFIGCEPYINGVAKLLKHIEDENINNIRIYPGDARVLMDNLDDNCIYRAFALFGDPWPKYRHYDRRFIGLKNLNTLSRILKNGAQLRVATDDSTYLRWILRFAPIHEKFKWIDNCPADWSVRRDDWFETRYEKKAVLQGRKPVYLTFVRKNR